MSVIVCVFNEIKTIEKILNKINSVKLQDNIQKEIIIIDNNSTDNSLNIIQSYYQNTTIQHTIIWVAGLWYF